MSVLARLPAGPEGRPERHVEFAGESTGRAYFVSALLAVGLHAGLILGWPGSRRFEPAEYGVVEGESAIEVELVAAPSETMAAPATEESAPTEELAVPPEPTETQEAVAVLEQPEPVPTPFPIQTLQEMPAPPQEMPTPKEIARPQPARTPVPASKRKAESAVRRPSRVGHASGRPGSETGAVRAKPGSQASKPAYLYNPHPSYPEGARRAGQTGVVMLRVS